MLLKPPPYNIPPPAAHLRPDQLGHPDYQVEYHEFSQRPLSDSCWSTQTGPDGRVYIACCVEHTGGGTATVVRHRASDNSLEYLFDLDQATGDLRDSGRATQCKIHYSFVPDPEHDLLYCATHLSGPPIGETRYNPWGAWHDPARAFRGAYLVAYDTRREQVHSVRLLIPREGCRCLCFDPRQRRLYALTYPRDHFVWYDLDRDMLHDLGRLGSVNSQCLFADRHGRIHTSVDSGRLLRFDPQTDRLEELPWVFPHANCQTAWHGVLYDAVQDPAGSAVYMTPWKSRPRLARFWPEEGPHGHLEDLGPLTQAEDPRRPLSVNVDHVGGLVFAGDGRLHYVKSKWWLEADGKFATRGLLCRLDPHTLRHEELCELRSPHGPNHYVARAAIDANGDLFMGKIMTSPAGFYRIRLANAPPTPAASYLRWWG